MNQYESVSLPCLGCEGQLGSYLPCELPGEPKLEVEALEPQRQRVVRTHPRAVGGLPLWLQCNGYSSAQLLQLGSCRIFGCLQPGFKVVGFWK